MQANHESVRAVWMYKRERQYPNPNPNPYQPAQPLSPCLRFPYRHYRHQHEAHVRAFPYSTCEDGNMGSSCWHTQPTHAVSYTPKICSLASPLATTVKWSSCLSAKRVANSFVHLASLMSW